MASKESSPKEPLNLVAERRRRNLGIVEAAKAIGISYNSLKLAEAGTEPRSDVARKICEFYGTTVLEQWPIEKAAA